jgi:hypothetical protein
MRPGASAISGNEVGIGQLDDLLTPVRGAVEESARDLGGALTKTGLMAGFCLWARRS